MAGRARERTAGAGGFGEGWHTAFLAGPGVTCSMAGRGAARGGQAYLGPRGLLCPGDMMIDRCDVGSHVVSESVEGGWLMPGT
jgi:hypothetical protein